MSFLKPIIFFTSLLPLVWTCIRIFLLGKCANPIQYCLHNSGEWALIFLLLSLSITPVRRMMNVQKIKPFRRMFGLFSFFYATLHLAIYIGVEHFFDWSAIYSDIIRHKRIIIGLVSYTILLILALTSFKHAIKRLGSKGWTRLHKFSYLAAISGVLHYFWLVKSDVLKPLLYGAVLFILLGYRAVINMASSKPESSAHTSRL